MKSKEEKKKSESESITFRIPAKLLNELRQESEKKQVSLNTLTNQIFRDHIVWHTYAKQTGLFYVSKPLISRVVNELIEEQLSSITEEAVKNKLKGSCFAHQRRIYCFFIFRHDGRLGKNI